MARDGNVITLNLDDLKIKPLNSDPVGGSPSYGAGIDIPAAQSITSEAQVTEKELPGDGTIVDYYSKIKGFQGEVKHGEISMDSLAVLLGGSNSDLGSAPNEVREFELLGDSLPGYFGMESQSVYMGEGAGGDFHLELFKCKISGFRLEQQHEEYAIISFQYKAIPLRSTKKLYKLKENQTKTDIVTSADSTPPTVQSSVPADAASGVNVNTTIQFTFSEAMRLATVTDIGAYFILTEAGVAVPFTLAYNSGTNTVTLTPTSALSATTQYRAGVTRLVQDVAGNRIAAQHIIDFETA